MKRQHIWTLEVHPTGRGGSTRGHLPVFEIDIAEDEYMDMSWTELLNFIDQAARRQLRDNAERLPLTKPQTSTIECPKQGCIELRVYLRVDKRVKPRLICTMIQHPQPGIYAWAGRSVSGIRRFGLGEVICEEPD